MRKITFIVVEQAYLIRRGICSVIEELPDTEIVARLFKMSELIEALTLKQPDFVIVNSQQMEGVNMLELTDEIANSKVNFIALDTPGHSPDTDGFFCERIKLEDRKGHILKKIQRLIDNCAPPKKRSNESDLTEREKNVLRGIALGQTNKQIADELFISAHTVVAHRKNITRKLSIKTAAGLTIYAVVNKIIDIAEINLQEP